MFQFPEGNYGHPPRNCVKTAFTKKTRLHHWVLVANARPMFLVRVLLHAMESTNIWDWGTLVVRVSLDYFGG